MADTPAQPGATTTLGYLADRSAQLAASLREVEAEILKGQGATSLADASRGSHARVARLRANLRETLQPLLDEAEGEGLRGDILKVGDEVRASEKRVAALEQVVECEASIDGAEAELGAGRVVEACAALDDAGSKLDALDREAPYAGELRRRFDAAATGAETRLRELLAHAVTADEARIAVEAADGVVCGRLADRPVATSELLTAARALGCSAEARILDEVVERCSPFVSRCLTAGNRDALTSDGSARRVLKVDADAVTENSVDAELCTKRAHQVVAFLDDALLGNDAYLRSKFHASLVAPLILPAVEKALVRDPRDVAPTQKQMAATRQAVEGLEADLCGRGYGSPSLVKALDQAATTAAEAARARVLDEARKALRGDWHNATEAECAPLVDRVNEAEPGEAAPPPTLLVSAVVLDLASIIDRAADEAASAPTAEMASTLFSGVRLSFELFRGFASLQDCSRSPRLARLLANDCLFCARLAARVSVDRGPAIGRAAAQPHLSLVDQIEPLRALADGFRAKADDDVSPPAPPALLSAIAA